MSKICVCVSLQAKEGHEEELKGFIIEAIPQAKSYPGCLHVDCGQAAEDKTRFIINGEWESEDARQAYMQWREETGFFDKLGHYLVSDPEILVYDIIWDYNKGVVD